MSAILKTTDHAYRSSHQQHTARDEHPPLAHHSSSAQQPQQQQQTGYTSKRKATTQLLNTSNDKARAKRLTAHPELLQLHDFELHRICAQILCAPLDDVSVHRTIYTDLYNLIVATYDNAAFQKDLHEHIASSANHKLRCLFYAFVDSYAHSPLSAAHSKIAADATPGTATAETVTGHTTLGTWCRFFSADYSLFSKFYHSALHPYIVHQQDMHCTKYVRDAHHPFRHCQGVLCDLFGSMHPILHTLIEQTADQYIQAAKDHLLHKARTADMGVLTAGGGGGGDSGDGGDGATRATPVPACPFEQNYNKLYSTLRTWFEWSKQLGLNHCPETYLGSRFLDYLPHRFAEAELISCSSFYTFFRALFDVMVSHRGLRSTPTTHRHKRFLASSIVRRYQLQDHWANAKAVFTHTDMPTRSEPGGPIPAEDAEDAEDAATGSEPEVVAQPMDLASHDCNRVPHGKWTNSLYFWPPLLSAIVNQDAETCKMYYTFIQNPTPALSRFKMFDNRACQSLFLQYALQGIRYQQPDADKLHVYYKFIKTVVIEWMFASGSTFWLQYESSFWNRFGSVMYKKLTAAVYHHHHPHETAVATREHSHRMGRELMRICLEQRSSDVAWGWFALLWKQYPDKDWFIYLYIEQHLCPSILAGTLHINHEDAFLLLCSECCQSECATALHKFRSLLHEWFYRSLDTSAFVINRMVWSLPQAHQVNLHPLIQAILDTKTKKYVNKHTHRSVNWSLHASRCTVTFREQLDGLECEQRQPRLVRLRANLFVMNLLLCIHSGHQHRSRTLAHRCGERHTLAQPQPQQHNSVLFGEWLQQLLPASSAAVEEANDTTTAATATTATSVTSGCSPTHQRLYVVLHLYMAHFIRCGIVQATSVITPHNTFEENWNTRISLVYPGHRNSATEEQLPLLETKTLEQLPDELVTASDTTCGHHPGLSGSVERADSASAQQLLLDRKSVLQAVVMRVLKAHAPEAACKEWVLQQTTEAISSFSVDSKDVDEAIDRLTNKEYAEWTSSCHTHLRYVP